MSREQRLHQAVLQLVGMDMVETNGGYGMVHMAMLEAGHRRHSVVRANLVQAADALGTYLWGPNWVDELLEKWENRSDFRLDEPESEAAGAPWHGPRAERYDPETEMWYAEDQDGTLTRRYGDNHGR